MRDITATEAEILDRVAEEFRNMRLQNEHNLKIFRDIKEPEDSSVIISIKEVIRVFEDAYGAVRGLRDSGVWLDRSDYSMGDQ